MHSSAKGFCCCAAVDRDRWRAIVTHLYRESIADPILGGYASSHDRRVKADELSDLAAELAGVSRRLQATEESLGWEIRSIEHGLEEAEELLVDTGAAKQLDDDAPIVVSGLEVDDMPEDLAFLERAGSSDARAELQLSIERAKQTAFLAGQREERVRFAEAIQLAKQLLTEELPSGAPPPRRRRWWKALGGLAKGGGMIALDGSLVLAGAPIPLATPAVAVAVVGSFTTGLEGLAGAASDLRGE